MAIEKSTTLSTNHRLWIGISTGIFYILFWLLWLRSDTFSTGLVSLCGLANGIASVVVSWQYDHPPRSWLWVIGSIYFGGGLLSSIYFYYVSLGTYEWGGLVGLASVINGSVCGGILGGILGTIVFSLSSEKKIQSKIIHKLMDGLTYGTCSGLAVSIVVPSGLFIFDMIWAIYVLFILAPFVIATSGMAGLLTTMFILSAHRILARV